MPESPPTIKALLPAEPPSQRILDKTGARNDVELALYAVRQELLTV